jgi:protocatechuate 3,4-dioxygenase beta subunit
MNKKLVAAALALVAVLGAVWWFKFHKATPKSTVVAASGSGSATGSGATKPATEDRWAKTTENVDVAPTSARWSFDIDPQGNLPLEGQVLGPDGKGVANADVWLSSVPPQSTKSKEDGTFAFEKLVGRTYELSAVAGDMVGGLAYKLTASSDPAVIKLAPGAALVVTVTDEDNRAISNASVSLSDINARKELTDKDGKATLHAVPPGWVAVEASADGFAPNGRYASIAISKEPTEIAIALKKGVPVAGRVVDEAGKPIKDAHVTPRSPRAWGGFNSWQNVVTDEKGMWKIPALAPGTYTFAANDGDHAPSDSKQTTIGTRATEGVEIVMKAGGVMGGTVVSTDGKAVPYATVRIARAEPGNQQGFGGALRQTVADDKGVFFIKGLPREKLQIRAESDAAASKLIPVDLATAAQAKDLKVTLDVTGTIGGIVVDETGQPVAEASVNATVDFMGGGDIAAASLSGFSTATTDGGGAFTIRGLPDGKYKVWAQRPGSGNEEWGQHGVAAKTGDKGVRVVLAAPGTITGKIVIEGLNKAPKFALVSEGWSPAVPTRDGTFELKNINPGKHDLWLRGSEFAQFVKHDIEVEPGKTTDVGTITLPRGRKIFGRVVDGKGRPVEGARVKLGMMLIDAGGDDASTKAMEDQAGIRSANTDANGEYSIIGVPTKATRAAASHAEQGASLALDVPAGEEDIRDINFTLKGFGSLAGKVMLKGAPLANTGVSVSPKGGTAVMAQTDANGDFVVERVPEGTVVVTVMRSKMMEMRTFSSEAQIVAGQRATSTINLQVGSITAEVQIKALPGAKVDAAQVFMFQGVAAAKTGGDLMKNFFGGSSSGPGGGMKFWLGKTAPFPTFEELQAGNYSICAVPITGDMSDNTFMMRIQENVETIKVYCKQVTVAPQPATQVFVDELPSMEPLPAPK